MDASNKFLINFTYESPSVDIIQNSGFNSDASINVKYTLTSVRDNLLKNIDLLNYLLENSNFIENINLMNLNCVINVNDELKLKEMLDLKIICPLNNSYIETNRMDNSEETHTDRLNMVYNLTCKNDFSSYSNSSSDSDSDLIFDTQKQIYICDKYYELM